MGKQVRRDCQEIRIEDSLPFQLNLVPVSDVAKTGVSLANIDKVKSIVQDKIDKLKKLGDEAWAKGHEAFVIRHLQHLPRSDSSRLTSLYHV